MEIILLYIGKEIVIICCNPSKFAHFLKPEIGQKTWLDVINLEVLWKWLYDIYWYLAMLRNTEQILVIVTKCANAKHCWYLEMLVLNNARQYEPAIKAVAKAMSLHGLAWIL